jgi:hypothetical protein
MKYITPIHTGHVSIMKYIIRTYSWHVRNMKYITRTHTGYVRNMKYSQSIKIWTFIRYTKKVTNITRSSVKYANYN